MGASYPIGGSNSCVFDKELNWNGLAFDRVTYHPWGGHFNWNQSRPRTKFFNIDVTTKECLHILQNETMNQKTIEYLSIDVDFGNKNFGYLALQNIINANIEFKILTLEHELYRIGDQIQTDTRNLLWSLGYIILFPNVSLRFDDNCQTLRPFEDWWINPKYFPNDIMQYGDENLVYDKCIERIKGYNP